MFTRGRSIYLSLIHVLPLKRLFQEVTGFLSLFNWTPVDGATRFAEVVYSFITSLFRTILLICMMMKGAVWERG